MARGGSVRALGRAPEAVAAQARVADNFYRCRHQLYTHTHTHTLPHNACQGWALGIHRVQVVGPGETKAHNVL